MHRLSHSILLVAFLLALLQPAVAVRAAPAITRGPYLQQATTNSMVVRWRTDVATASQVRFGEAPGAFAYSVADPAVAINHVVAVTNLLPDTKYFYEVGTGTAWFAGDTNDFFVTAPPVGTRKPTSIWVLGDSGEANADSIGVRNAYLARAAARRADVFLMLGDNAYDDGTDAEYQAAVFNMYPTILQNTVLWPTIGNHDAHEEDATGHFPYFDIFTLPTQAEAGGVPSGTEKYYSFDHANIHFICLDSMTSSRATNSPMSVWLRADLAATTQEWIIAYWHHPPYSKGTHNSDTETELIEMRQNYVPILESFGVDLVLCGHSHNYERSWLMDGHYGSSSTFSQSMKKNAGNGREDGNGAYIKPGGEGNEGAVYAVAGSAAGGSTPSAHPALLIRSGMEGSLIIDVASNRLDYTFLTRYGTNGDWFTLIKTWPTPTNPPTAPTNLIATAVGLDTINLSWVDTATNENGFKVERSLDGTNFMLFSMIGPDVTAGSDGNRTPSTTYHYRVRAWNAAGESSWSEIASATTFAPPPDTNAPAAITNLFVHRVTSNSVTLFWSSPGDDGNYGVATSYDFRFNVEAIGEANWDSAISVTNTSSPPAPAPAGNFQMFTVTGLEAATTYYFAVRTRDETNNISPLSNIPSATTLAPDYIFAPAGLSATALASNEIALLWTDNADNEEFFNVERSDDGTNFVLLGTSPAGVTNVVDTNSAASTRYLYRVIACHASGCSLPSNIAEATTPDPIPPDTTPPAAVTNLRFVAVNTNSVTIAWTSPGDDTNSGTAISYDIRWLHTPISADNWSTANALTNLPAPQPAGMMQTVSVAGLIAGTTYYFALTTTDDAGNVSPLSNVPWAVTRGLPPPWRNRDIGSVGLSGSAAHTNGVFTVRGAGSDIGGSSDRFHFVYQPATGNCEIIARVTTISNTSSSAKAGVMIRETTNSNSRFAMLALTPDRRVQFLRRTSSGNDVSTSTASGSDWRPPIWLRVTRTNNVFSSWHSTNGVNWIASSPRTFTMGSNSFIGLGVTSRTTSRLNTSTFDGVIARP